MKAANSAVGMELFFLILPDEQFAVTSGVWKTTEWRWTATENGIREGEA